MGRHRTIPNTQQFGRWTFIALGGPTKYLVRCECGTEKEIEAASLKKGTSKSCGCLRDELTKERFTGRTMKGKNIKHGMANTAPYVRWRNMMKRCYNQNHHKYHLYGGRGISVCERWHDFAAYYQDVGDPPAPGLTLDRKNNGGNYEPSNVRWATSEEQLANRRPYTRHPKT